MPRSNCSTTVGFGKATEVVLTPHSVAFHPFTAISSFNTAPLENTFSLHMIRENHTGTWQSCWLHNSQQETTLYLQFIYTKKMQWDVQGGQHISLHSIHALYYISLGIETIRSAQVYTCKSRLYLLLLMIYDSFFFFGLQIEEYTEFVPRP